MFPDNYETCNIFYNILKKDHYSRLYFVLLHHTLFYISLYLRSYNNINVNLPRRQLINSNHRRKHLYHNEFSCMSIIQLINHLGISKAMIAVCPNHHALFCRLIQEIQSISGNGKYKNRYKKTQNLAW